MAGSQQTGSSHAACSAFARIQMSTCVLLVCPLSSVSRVLPEKKHHTHTFVVPLVSHSEILLLEYSNAVQDTYSKFFFKISYVLWRCQRDNRLEIVKRCAITHHHGIVRNARTDAPLSAACLDMASKNVRFERLSLSLCDSHRRATKSQHYILRTT